MKPSNLHKGPGDTPEALRARAIRHTLDRAVDDFVTDLDPQAFQTRPPWPGAEEIWGTSREPLPLPAIQAARVIAAEARHLEKEAIAHARGMGESWTNIGKALGEQFVKTAAREEMKLGLAAWRYAAHGVMPGEQIPWSPSYERDNARWRCWTCGQHIAESHPDNGPDAEAGHAVGCERLARRRRAGYR